MSRRGGPAKHCNVCQGEERLPFKCSFCKVRFCREHRIPEKHNCPGLRIDEPLSRWFESELRSKKRRGVIVSDPDDGPRAGESDSDRGREASRSEMERCDLCTKDVEQPQPCRLCTDSFCRAHSHPQMHDCPELSTNQTSSSSSSHSATASRPTRTRTSRSSKRSRAGSTHPAEYSTASTPTARPGTPEPDTSIGPSAIGALPRPSVAFSRTRQRFDHRRRLLRTRRRRVARRSKRAARRWKRELAAWTRTTIKILVILAAIYFGMTHGPELVEVADRILASSDPTSLLP